MGDRDLREQREAVVRRHMEAENVHDFDAVIDTFAHPRYELIASGGVHGEAAVRCERVYFDSATILRQLTGAP